MAIAYLRVSSISRGKGKSAVAAAAYRSGKKLRDNADGKIKDYSHKAKEVVYHDIFLPPQAPEEHHNPEKFWNDVQVAEIKKSPNAQYAKQIEIALPYELSLDENITALKDFIADFLVRGYGAQIDIHNKPGNPHAHIMITSRPYASNGKFDMTAKQKKDYVYARDAKGKKIPILNEDGTPKFDKTGNPAYKKVPLLDAQGKQRYLIRPGKGKQALWRTRCVKANYLDDPKSTEHWKGRWQTIINCKLKEKGDREIDFDLYNSIDRHGLKYDYQVSPQIHLGPKVHTLMKKGISTNISDTYSMIRQHNGACLENLQINYQDWYNQKWCPPINTFQSEYLKNNYVMLLSKRLKYIQTLPDNKVNLYKAKSCLTLIKYIKEKISSEINQAEKYQSLFTNIYGSKEAQRFIIYDYAYRGRLRKMNQLSWQYEHFQMALKSIPVTSITPENKATLKFYKKNVEEFRYKLDNYTKNNHQSILQRAKYAAKRISAYYTQAKITKDKNIKMLDSLKTCLSSITNLEKSIINKTITILSEAILIKLELIFNDSQCIEKYKLPEFQAPTPKQKETPIVKITAKKQQGYERD